MKDRIAPAAFILSTLVAAPVLAQEPAPEVFVKKAIADSMTPDELAAYKERLRANVRAGRLGPHAGDPDQPADTCTAATPELVPNSAAFAGTTVGDTDNYDLPPDVTAPTCTAPGTCTGAGPAGSLPRGAIYTGTGTGPDRAYRIICDNTVTLTITMDPTGPEDLALIVYRPQCSSALSDCLCVADTGIGGVAESVSLQALQGQDYFIVVDGYSTGATPPGPSGPYTLDITSTPFFCDKPVELIEFTIG